VRTGSGTNFKQCRIRYRRFSNVLGFSLRHVPPSNVSLTFQTGGESEQRRKLGFSLFSPCFNEEYSLSVLNINVYSSFIIKKWPMKARPGWQNICRPPAATAVASDWCLSVYGARGTAFYVHCRTPLNRQVSVPDCLLMPHPDSFLRRALAMAPTGGGCFAYTRDQTAVVQDFALSFLPAQSHATRNFLWLFSSTRPLSFN